MASSASAQGQGRITDEAVEDLRTWLGVPRRERGWVSSVTEDAVWHFALGVGDDNPLWWDRDYAASTRWGRMFAPPTFLYSCSNAGLRVGESGIYPAQDWMPGTLPLWLSDRWVFERPAFVGEAVTATSELIEVEERPGKNGTREVRYIDRTTYVGEGDAVIGARYGLMLRRDRPEAGALPDLQPVVAYSDEERAAIASQYEVEVAQRRGSRPLRGSDLSPGAAVPTLVKGPLTITNIVGWILGWGSPLCPTNRIAHQYLLEHPRAGLEDRGVNVLDTIEGVHWNPLLAQASGMPGCYDFGTQRVSWMAHLLTDWMGDDGFLAELDVQVRRPNFVGDTTWLGGEVVSLEPAGDSVRANLSLRAVNQRGEETTRATAKVLLPA